MKSKVKYTDGPMGEMKIIDDFLPPPEKLGFKNESVKITISLSKDSVDFFKDQAERNKTGYQTMIRDLLDFYARRYQSS